MAQLVKLEKQLELKASGPDKFYNFFKSNMSSFPQMFPSNVKSFELVGGGSTIKTGSLTSWRYSFDGTTVGSAKAKVESADDARKTVKFVITEGDLLKEYKSFKAEFQVGPNYVKVTIQVEKSNSNSPNPDEFMELALKVCKGIDDHLK